MNFSETAVECLKQELIATRSDLSENVAKQFKLNAQLGALKLKE